MTDKSIMIVGVGGQGTLLASKILGSVAMSQSFDVKLSEVHGMAQRGGSVVTYVKYGKEVLAPIISLGEADIILAFEELEAARWIPYLKKGGTIVINRQKIEPMPVITGAAQYPENICEEIGNIIENTYTVNALELAQKAGTSKAVNVVLIGVLAKISSFEKQVWVDAIKSNVPDKFLDMNLQAFESGYNSI